MTADDSNVLDRAVTAHSEFQLHGSTDVHAPGEFRILRRRADFEPPRITGGSHARSLGSGRSRFAGWPALAGGSRQQRWAEMDGGAIYRVFVDFETHGAVFEHKVDHATQAQKGVVLANQNNARRGQRRDCTLRSFASGGGAEKDQLTEIHFAIGVHPFDDDRVGSGAFARNRLLERVDELLVAADHANQERRGRVRQIVLRPFRPLGKVVEISGLDLIFAGGLGLHRCQNAYHKCGEAGSTVPPGAPCPVPEFGCPAVVRLTRLHPPPQNLPVNLMRKFLPSCWIASSGSSGRPGSKYFLSSRL